MIVRTNGPRVPGLLPFLVCACVATFATGCGEPYYAPPVKASGKITVMGKPLTRGTIYFVPVDREVCLPGSAVINSDGTFKAQTKKPDDGLCPGEYVVFLGDEASSDASKKNADGPIPKHYLSAGTSDLKQRIDDETDSLAFDLQLEDKSKASSSKSSYSKK
ncbi:MAG: hypothetical protein JWN70_5501 [Planctomycetaceae bacterium]|nr:hypothetical protein [Planctomycetaceae bacterium]